MQEFPPFRLDPVNQCLWRRRAPGDDERILLPPKAFAVLHYLVAHAGRLVTQEELLEAVWPETYVQPEVLRNHILAQQERTCHKRQSTIVPLMTCHKPSLLAQRCIPLNVVVTRG
jgi:DNA-binding response OmpR family regulator